MKVFIAIVISMLAVKTVFAGDNGSYLNCRSASGKTQVILGQYGSYGNEIAMLSILGKSIGEMQVDVGVSKELLGNGVIRYLELDKERTDLLTVQLFPQTEKETKRGITRGRVLSGFNANTMAPLNVIIDIVCRTVYNPI